MSPRLTPWMIIFVASFFFVWHQSVGPVQTATIPLFLSYLFLRMKNERPTIRLFLLLCIVALFVLTPVATIVRMNHDEQVLDVLPAIKAATQNVLAGKNPYVENYYGTVLDAATPYNVDFWKKQGMDYLPLQHFVYLPTIFLLSVPFEWAFPLASYAALCIILLIGIGIILLAGLDSVEKKENMLTLFFLSPLLIGTYTIIHPVDLLIIFLLVSLSMLLMRNRNSEAAIVLGLALGTKVYVWALVPFIFFFWLDKKETRSMVLSIVTFLAILSPFVLSNMGALLEDTVFFLIGNGSNALKVWVDQQGFFPTLVKLGVIPSTLTWLSLPLMAGAYALIMYHYFKSDRRLETTLVYAGLAIIAVLFFSKTMNENYLSFPFFLITCAVLVHVVRDKENDST